MTDLPAEPWRMTATEAADSLSTGRIGTSELLDSVEARIAAVDPIVHALPTLCFDRARERAPAMTGTLLGGLPTAIKDLVDVGGVRTTLGAPLYENRVPDTSDDLVTRLESRGGLVVAKSNTPEFGAGANTFNPIFETTLNPWNPELTPGGSSGGAAAALASGMVFLAHGSDLGGSLRTPAAFTGTVGMRPTAGLVGRGPRTLPFEELFVDGPMARNVADLGLFLDALAGSTATDGVSRMAEAGYRSAAEAPQRPLRVAYAPGLGQWPVDPRVKAILDAAVETLADEGVEIIEACPDFSAAKEIFHVLRGLLFAAEFSELLPTHEGVIKPDVVWNIKSGQELTGEKIGWALRERGRLLHRFAAFMQEVDLLLSAAAIVPPFSPSTRYVTHCGDHEFETYIDWLGVTFAVSLVNCPAISLPVGIDATGMPVGLQAVAGPRAEPKLLSHAAWMEGLYGMAERVPVMPTAPTPE